MTAALTLALTIPAQTDHTKEVLYKCGCTELLGGWLEEFAPFYCGEHGERLNAIVELEEEE